MEEAYRQDLAYYAQARRPPQRRDDITGFLETATFPPELNLPHTARWASPAYREVMDFLDMDMGIEQNGFVEMGMRQHYGQLFQIAARELLDYLDNPPQPIPEEETFPYPIPVPQDYGSGVRRRRRVGKTTQLVGGCEGCEGECGGSSTKRQQFLAAHKLPDKSYSLKQLASISKVPLQTLQEVYNRGIGAYRTSPESVRLKGSFVKGVKAPMSAKLSKEQWAISRVYSFLTGNPTHDQDLREDRGGKRVTFARKYLRGRGVRATKGNIRKVLDSMDVEGVVFES